VGTAKVPQYSVHAQDKIMSILVTGGAGFIGSNFVLDWLAHHDEPIINLDKLTYAGNLGNLAGVQGDTRYVFVRGDIRDGQLVGRLLAEHHPRIVINFAAESHVDRSIHGPGEFIQTNIVGTFQLLESVRAYWEALKGEAKEHFRFLQVSTDEVFGALGPTGKFSETTPYQPNSPYSASKASADHLVRAWHHTYGLPVLTTNCSNNYGPRQLPEKLIPLVIANALAGRPLPVYGTGQNVRDWIHVEDHCRGVHLALTRGKPGETYCFGGNAERKNIDVVTSICDLLAEKLPETDYHALISYVTDRAGHDWRYAIDDSKAVRELGFTREYNFESGLRQTIEWYLTHLDWCESVTSKKAA